MPTGKDQRKHRRYNLSLPVRVKSNKRGAYPAFASSRDISAQGIYLTVSKDFELGSSLELDLELPQALAQGVTVRIHCRAKVIRVDKLNQGNKVGVAAHIESYQFIRDEPDEEVALSQSPFKKTASGA
jgi:hypothetical protein